MADKQPREVTRAQVALGLGAQAIVFVVIGGALWRMSGRPLARFVVVDWPGVAAGLAIGVAMIALAALTFRLSPRFFDWSARQQAGTYVFLEKTASTPMFVWISLCAGIGEEALFRGGLVPLAADYIGMPAAIALTSLAFAMIHLAKPLITLLLVVVGCLFGVAYWYTGSLLAVMIGHVIYDIWAIWMLHQTLQRIGYESETPAI